MHELDWRIDKAEEIAVGVLHEAGLLYGFLKEVRLYADKNTPEIAPRINLAVCQALDACDALKDVIHYLRHSDAPVRHIL